MSSKLQGHNEWGLFEHNDLKWTHCMSHGGYAYFISQLLTPAGDFKQCNKEFCPLFSYSNAQLRYHFSPTFIQLVIHKEKVLQNNETNMSLHYE